MISTKDSISTDGVSSARKAAQELTRSQRVMVLATCDPVAPWCAPVYFVYTEAGFCFFSSPRSEHIRHIEAVSAAAASIFSDSGQWRQIQGLQMRGRVHKLDEIGERLKATARFIRKFPFTKDFLQGGPGAAPGLSHRVKLYSFLPSEVYLVDNSTAFGRRIPLEIDFLEAAAQNEE